MNLLQSITCNYEFFAGEVLPSVPASNIGSSAEQSVAEAVSQRPAAEVHAGKMPNSDQQWPIYESAATATQTSFNSQAAPTDMWQPQQHTTNQLAVVSQPQPEPTATVPQQQDQSWGSSWTTQQVHNQAQNVNIQSPTHRSACYAADFVCPIEIDAQCQ